MQAYITSSIDLVSQWKEISEIQVKDLPNISKLLKFCNFQDPGELHVKAVELNQDDLQVHMMGTTAQSVSKTLTKVVLKNVSQGCNQVCK